MKKTYVVEIENKRIRTVFAEKPIRVGDLVSTEIWLGYKIEGGIVTKVYR